jgi:hypothetical protein
MPTDGDIMTSSTRYFTAALCVSLAAIAAGAGVKFTSTWAAPEARTANFKGKKVAALVVSDDLSLRMSAEEALSRELSARGIQGVAAYRAIPAEELKNSDRAKAWLQRDGIAGLIALRPVSQTEQQRPAVEVWTSPYYSTLWGYYPYSWGAVYNVGPPRTDTLIVVEALIFDAASGKLLWGGMSEAMNPRTLQTLVHDITKEAAEKIGKQFR